MKLNTLRARVVTWYVGLLAVALIVFAGTLYFGVREYLVTSMRQSLAGEASAIATTFLSFEEQKGPEWMAGEVNEAYAPEVRGRFIRITRQDGARLFQSGDARDPVIHASQVSPAINNSGLESFRTDAHGSADGLLICTHQFISSSGTRYWIETGSPIDPIQHVLSSLLRIILAVIPVILVAAAFGGPMLMGVPLQPLISLAERAEHIGMSKLGERLPVLATGDEMERLSLSLNRMISRLEDALSHNRRFSADVSHELRTPLTIMRGELEHVLQQPSMSASVRTSVGSALDEIQRMTKIVENLLAIARLDAGKDAIDVHPTDISELCRWTVEQMHLLAEEKEIAVTIETAPLMVLADKARMKQVFVNLLDNAIKYTPNGGKIKLSCFAQASNAVIEIHDTGIGISADALPHVFDRFFRANRDRARVSGGTGLGLSIVKAICIAHSGSITLRSSPGAGTVVNVELPLMQTASPSNPSAHAPTLIRPVEAEVTMN